ncbi:unnamed protein product [Adineta ricciae]|uniref:G-protein coupled receptors family 1 profile domain-containing protein n=1 Tax=Adineta ricciae TaxID=249248 RepID=A0A815PII3_ADIRI|nr:unnamed protein product [Adineta ricciae]CAF1628448.1 unnamed protein product [Adineta ricciae]
MSGNFSIQATLFTTNSTAIINEFWFVPSDILMIICSTLIILLSGLFLLVIVVDKTCHTIPMLLTAHSYIALLIIGCDLLGLATFMLKNDLKQLEYEDSICAVRGYICYTASAVTMYSYLLQSIHRYLTTVYPHRLFWQSMKFYVILLCSTWIWCYIYPIAFLFTKKITYNVDNQICQIPLRSSLILIYTSSCMYTIPVSLVVFIYFKLVRYVRGMNERAVPANILFRAQRQLKMTRRLVIIVALLAIIGIPYMSFVFIAFFTDPPRYHLRFAQTFTDLSVLCATIVLFGFTDPLKASLMKKLRRRTSIAPIR